MGPRCSVSLLGDSCRSHQALHRLLAIQAPTEEEGNLRPEPKAATGHPRESAPLDCVDPGAAQGAPWCPGGKP
ncbi:hypothetical protein NDU88_001965 [Pleurodeles waltl]|uniref:Uncharacterized protein n=1 Tax=Pleurodeles waltl TaxID=8319 RepID=A0AAV7WNM7_PLEWA|nr:hypothetical protein NDU88_001965 [Pleurodeles waltl]